MKIIRRDDIEAINHVEIDGKVHDLGIVKIFANQPDLAKFVPQQSGLAISWVHLDEGQELAAHRHPEPSLILMCDGSGFAFGDVEQEIHSGDTVLVPSGALHGFRGGKGGFWALSVQFEGQALYENIETPRVQFEATRAKSGLDRLLELNDLQIEKYREADLVSLLKNPAIENEQVKQTLLDCVQIFSDQFQLLLHLRVALTDNPEHKKVAIEHLLDELGHNDNLRKQRGVAIAKNEDAILNLAMNWFKNEMMTASDLERTALMHLVLETSGEVFHAEAANVFGDMNHFAQHGEDDAEHAEIGIVLLKDATDEQLAALEAPLLKGWEMINVMCNRMAALALAAQTPAAA